MPSFLDDEHFNLFSKLIYDQSGIHFSESNRCILESRLKERLKAADLSDLTAYYSLILKNQAELHVLLDSVTTNLTRFFRNTAHFEALEKQILTDIVEHKKKSANNRIKIWSAGCSTGEEPYSLAMLFKEKLPRQFAVEIVASDISLKSLMIAKEGFYAEGRVVGIPEDYLWKYFEKKKPGFQIKPEIKQLVKFDYHNLKYDSGLRNLDLVFCRNVLIYFDSEAQKQAVNRFYQAMQTYSYLFIGHSESLFGMNTGFEFVKTPWATLYGKGIKDG